MINPNISTHLPAPIQQLISHYLTLRVTWSIYGRFMTILEAVPISSIIFENRRLAKDPYSTALIKYFTEILIEIVHETIPKTHPGLMSAK